MVLPLRVLAHQLPGMNGPPRSIDALAIVAQPLAHFVESRDLSRLDAAVSHRSNVQQIIAISADYSYQRLDALPKRFDLVIGDPGPPRAERHVGFPSTIEFGLAYFLLGGLMVAGQAAAAVDDHVRLKLADHPDQIVHVPILGSAAKTIPPDDIDLAVVAAKLANLTVHVVDIAMMILGAIVFGWHQSGSE